jgi:hypothetical protein
MNAILKIISKYKDRDYLEDEEKEELYRALVKYIEDSINDYLRKDFNYKEKTYAQNWPKKGYRSL